MTTQPALYAAMYAPGTMPELAAHAENRQAFLEYASQFGEVCGMREVSPNSTAWLPEHLFLA